MGSGGAVRVPAGSSMHPDGSLRDLMNGFLQEHTGMGYPETSAGRSGNSVTRAKRSEEGLLP